MGFGFKRQPNPAPSSTLADCAADYAAAAAHRRDLLSNRDDANVRANASEAAASRTTDNTRRGWRS